jgi:hypothetical protein
VRGAAKAANAATVTVNAIMLDAFIFSSLLSV